MLHIIHGEDGVVLGTPACWAPGFIDDQWPLFSLAEKVKLSSSTMKTMQAATGHNSPASTIHYQLHYETSNLESIPAPLDDDLLCTFKCMHHPADEVHPKSKLAVVYG